MNARLRRFAQDLLHRLGWDVRRSGYPSTEDAILSRFLAVSQPNVVFDVGANIGQYGSSLRKCGFGGRIISFEALPRVHNKLTEVAAKDRDWIVAPCCALGRAAGEIQINLSENVLSSSILPMHPVHLEAAPESKYVATEKVRLERLDQIAGALLPRDARVLLKIDTQGYEEEVLAGAGSMLEVVCALQVELSVVTLYKGAPTMRRMLELCEELGFEIYGLIPGFYAEKTGRLLQVDGLFLRIGSQ